MLIGFCPKHTQSPHAKISPACKTQENWSCFAKDFKSTLKWKSPISCVKMHHQVVVPSFRHSITRKKALKRSNSVEFMIMYNSQGIFYSPMTLSDKHNIYAKGMYKEPTIHQHALLTYTYVQEHKHNTLYMHPNVMN